MRPIVKRLLDPSRLRVLPKEGFSWIDRRFFRDGFVDALSSDEILLYLFLCSVADRYGLSFYRPESICRLVKLTEPLLEEARSGLLESGLIRFEFPLYQVLALPEFPPRLERPLTEAGSMRSIGEILRELR